MAAGGGYIVITHYELGRLFAVEDLSEYTTYKKLLDRGFSIYGKPGNRHLYIVPPGDSHSDAWRAVRGTT